MTNDTVASHKRNLQMKQFCNLTNSSPKPLCSAAWWWWWFLNWFNSRLNGKLHNALKSEKSAICESKLFFLKAKINGVGFLNFFHTEWHWRGHHHQWGEEIFHKNVDFGTIFQSLEPCAKWECIFNSKSIITFISQFLIKKLFFFLKKTIRCKSVDWQFFLYKYAED